MNRYLICDVPEGQKGDWKVEHFEVQKQDTWLASLRADINPSCMGRGHIDPGIYTRLMHQGNIVMSDVPDEMNDFKGFVRGAKEVILVTGLGLGMTVEALLQNRMVRKVIVVEIEKDVIDLVGAHYLKKWSSTSIEIVHADALTWKNPMKYKFNRVWHDIWPTICADNLPSMKKLHRKYGHWLASNGYQQSWSREECELALSRCNY